jgi:tetratricopeptide (TPR) repeat protein
MQVTGSFIAALRSARAAFDAGDHAAAQREAERARSMYPEYAGDNGPHMMLFEIHSSAGDTAAAVAALGAHVALRESDYDAHITLADLLARTGDDAGAADVLERAMYIHPYDAAIHDRMATLYAETGRHAKAVRERRAIVALNPVNRADALYRLAAALFDAGDRAEARRQVLRSLEIAPNYAEAQQLLLRLQGESQ